MTIQLFYTVLLAFKRLSLPSEGKKGKEKEEEGKKTKRKETKKRGRGREKGSLSTVQWLNAFM